MQPVRVQATPKTQDDPVALCREGISLFLVGRTAEALPLLEAGFSERENVNLTNPDVLAKCALTLGLLYKRAGHFNDALDAYTIALYVIRTNGIQAGEGTALLNIGSVYSATGRYLEALDALEQALNIARDMGNRDSEGTVLNNMGVVYRAEGRYIEALEAYQQALIIQREVGDRIGEGTALNNIGKLLDDQGRYVEALNTLLQALEIERELNDSAGQGTTLNNIGSVYSNQGLYSEALSAYQQALNIRRQIGDLAGEGKTINNIATVYHHQGRYTDALEAYQQALNIILDVGNRSLEAVVFNNIGSIYQDMGRYSDALEALQLALSIRREVGDRSGEGTTLNNIGTLYQDQGRYASALEALQLALRITREVGERSGEGTTLSNIGTLYENQGRYASALEALQLALSIRREVGDRSGEGTTLNNIGSVYHGQGRYPEALHTYEQALRILRELGDQAGEGGILNNIGTVYHDLGSSTEALQKYQQALRIRRAVGDRYGEGITLSNIAVVYRVQGLYTEALEIFQQALSISREIGDVSWEGAILNNIGVVYGAQIRNAEALKTYQQSLKIRREQGDQAGESATLMNIGHLYRQQGETEKALTYYEQAMDVLEFIRTTAGSESGRDSFVSQHVDLYQRSVKLYTGQGDAKAAFYTSERGRARAFLDSLSTSQVQLADNAAESLYIAEQEAYTARQVAQDALAQAKAQEPPDPNLISELEAQLAVAEAEHQTALKAIEARGDQLAALVPGRSTVLTLPDVQALLDNQTTLVSYYVLGDTGSLAFIITRDWFETVELPHATPENLLNAITNLRLWPTLTDPYPKPLQDLHALLVAPVEEYLTSNWIGIIPHQLLHYVPFAALTNGQTYFGDQHTLFNLPSASSYKFIQQNALTANATTGQPALVFGNPDIGEQELSPLLYAESEAKTVADLLGAPFYTKAAASEEQFWQSANDAEIIHLAAHGGYNQFNPLYSAIYLGSSGEQDGLLEVHEIYSLDLSTTDLVVLSACETNIGELSAGDEVVGLTRAFFFAGTPTVISSLWNVDDEATAKLMQSFYTLLQDGMSKAEALRQAQVDVREEYPSPFYWAGFVLTGDPGVGEAVTTSVFEENVQSADGPNLWNILWILVSSTAVVKGFFWLWSRRKQKLS